MPFCVCCVRFEEDFKRLSIKIEFDFVSSQISPKFSRKIEKKNNFEVKHHDMESIELFIHVLIDLKIILYFSNELSFGIKKKKNRR